MSSNYEYHQLLEYLYFNDYADSYENAEHLIQQLSDEEYQDLYENVSGGRAKRAKHGNIDQSVSDKEADEVRAPGREQRAEKEAARKKQELKDTLGSRGASLMASRGADSDSVPMASSKRRSEPTGGGVSGNTPVLRRRKPNGHATRGSSPEHIATQKARDLAGGGPETKARQKKIRAALKKSKKWGTPEARNEAYVLEHLISEGYADDYNCAVAICESMSDEWFESILSEEFKDLTPDKEKRVKNRVGELARDIQVSGARMKELNKKPFGKYRPKVKAEKESILKSARKKHKHVTNASDALTRTSVSREAGIVKKMYDLKKRMDDELNQ